MKRRDFLTNTGSAIIGIGLVQSFECCSKDSVTPAPSGFTIDLTDSTYAALTTVGGSVLVNGIYIIRTGQSVYLAISSICTHQGCSVGYNSSSKRFVCPCHGGVYDINGNVLSGPPPSPLPRYQATLSGTTLTVAG